MQLLFTRDTVIERVTKASTGSAAVSRNRFKEEVFLGFEISLPPLATQRKIVDVWRKGHNELLDMRASVEKAVNGLSAMFLGELGLSTAAVREQPRAFAVTWGELFAFSPRATYLANSNRSLHLGKFPVVSGRDCLSEIRHGSSASPSSEPTGLEVIKISAVTRGVFDPNERKYAVDAPRVREEFDLRKGDILLCRTNGTLAYVGMSALVRENQPNLIFPDKVIRVRTRPNAIPEFITEVLKSHPVRSQIEAAARTAVGNFAIGTQDLWDLQLPLPPIEEQKRLAKLLDARHAEIRKARLRVEEMALALQRKLDQMTAGSTANA